MEEECTTVLFSPPSFALQQSNKQRTPSPAPFGLLLSLPLISPVTSESPSLVPPLLSLLGSEAEDSASDGGDLAVVILIFGDRRRAVVARCKSVFARCELTIFPACCRRWSW